MSPVRERVVRVVDDATSAVERLLGDGPPRDWVLDLAAGALVLALGLVEVSRYADYGVGTRLPLVVLLVTAAVTVVRHRPSVAIGLTWVLGSIQLLGRPPILFVQLAIAFVAFGTARWGGRVTLWVSGLSIPVAIVLGSFWAVGGISRVGDVLSSGDAVRLLDLGTAYGVLVRATTVAGPVLLVIGVPWLTGLAVRSATRARTSDLSRVAAEDEAARALLETHQAREIARLRDEQARMARDVHDVVGHSLAVILAQAESAQFLPDSDPAGLKGVMSTIATSARTSLQDVREVLSATGGSGPGRDGAPRQGGLDALVEGTRSSGCDVRSEAFGRPVPMPPELEAVAFRVLQEMLTNAIRHGRRDSPIHVEQHWPSGAWDHDLRLEVRNVVDDATGTGLLPDGGARPGGRGLDGMQRRLQAVGGRLDVRRRDETDGSTFTGTAWVPVRAS